MLRLRVEDVVCLGFVGVFVAVAGARSLSGLAITEEAYWELCFIVAPAVLLVFMTALRYAITGGRTVTSPLLSIGGIVRAWLPFLMFLLIYQVFQSRLLATISGADRDAVLLSLDRALVRETPAVLLQAIVSPFLTDTMTVAYALHLVLPPVIAFSWYRKDQLVFREFLLAVLVSAVLGGIGYFLVPATGPGLAFPELFTVELAGWLHTPLLGLMDAARAPRDVFPSLHVGVSTIVLWFSRRLPRKAFLAVLALVLLNWLSTLYLRYHYLVDVLAGWAVAAVSVASARLLLGIERRLYRGVSGASDGSRDGTPIVDRT